MKSIKKKKNKKNINKKRMIKYTHKTTQQKLERLETTKNITKNSGFHIFY